MSDRPWQSSSRISASTKIYMQRRIRLEAQRLAQTIARKAKRITEAFWHAHGSDLRSDTPTQLSIDISVPWQPDNPLTEIPRRHRSRNICEPGFIRHHAAQAGRATAGNKLEQDKSRPCIRSQWQCTLDRTCRTRHALCRSRRYSCGARSDLPQQCKADPLPSHSSQASAQLARHPPLHARFRAHTAKAFPGRPAHIAYPRGNGRGLAI